MTKQIQSIKRRSFIQTLGVGAGTLLLPQSLRASSAAPEIPTYLKGYEKIFAENPRAAALRWFREAKFGLFLHYGLYSLEGRHEWLQLYEKIPIATYAKLKDRFTAEKFDADFITDLALAAEMRYVNITTRHHDGFCLFATKQTDFNSVNSPAKRDLVAELANACASAISSRNWPTLAARRASGSVFTIRTVATGGIRTRQTTIAGAAAPGLHTTRRNRPMPRARIMI
ncbi:MAG: hypothetical protein RLY69_619 [Verrucomicrobiota bacterium]